jgi:hypothetical protein
LAPPTLVSHLLTHGCSPFAVTRRNSTALDIVTAHSVLPDRDDVRLLLEEAMREEGWTGTRMDERRRAAERKAQRLAKRQALQQNIGKVLDIGPSWWGELDLDSLSDSSDDEEDTASEDSEIFVSFQLVLVLSFPHPNHVAIDSFPGLYVYASFRTACITRHLPDAHNRFSASDEECRTC